MGPKKRAAEPPKETIQEIDKAFYELQISDLNNKLARLRSTNSDLETKFLDSQDALQKLDADRGDVIAYLKRSLTASTTEIESLNERILQMEADREGEVKVYKDKMVAVEKEYKLMHRELSAEIKLLAGKMGSLDEYRTQRDDLMKKYEEQEERIEEQEVRHKRVLYESERKFVLGKDTLKKEMEARLMQLSTDFQKATEMRIAATTQRVIRENIAINNELDLFLETLNRLEQENQNYKTKCNTLRLEAELHNKEKKVALSKLNVHLQLINRLTFEHDEMLSKLRVLQNAEHVLISVKTELAMANKTVDVVKMDLRVLEQHLHAARSEKIDYETELGNARAEIDRLKDIIYDSTMIMKNDLKKLPKGENNMLVSAHKELVKSIIKLLDRSEKELPARVASLETVPSIGATYRKGELGYIPLPAKKPHKYIRNVENKITQVTPSLELMEPFVRKIPSGEEFEAKEVSTAEVSVEEETESLSSSSSSVEEEDQEMILVVAPPPEEDVAAEFEMDEYDELEYEADMFDGEEITPNFPLSETDESNPPA